MTQLIPNSAHARDAAYHVHPQTNLAQLIETGPNIIVRGDGIRIYDSEGREFIDALAGLGCASLGFANERLAKVAYEQMCTLGYYQTYAQNANPLVIELAEALLKIAPTPMSKVLFQCSGAEANDTAIKLVWYYHHAIGKPKKLKIIGRNWGYHGSTCATISAVGRPDMHEDFGLPLDRFLHTEFPHFYRFHHDGETEEQFARRLADSLEALILAEGPETIGAFIAEPIMSAAGAVPPPRTYFDEIQAVLRKYEILFLVDEVICGFGRTGAMWGSQTFGIKADMLSCAKALSSAMQPISALMINENIYQALLAESRKIGNFGHGYTHAGHPVTSAVALETLRVYEEMDLVGRVKRIGPHLKRVMDPFVGHPLVGRVDVNGIFVGFELVKDKRTRQPFGADPNAAAAVQRNARKRGLLVRAGNSRIVMSPAPIITEADVDEFGRLFGLALDDALAEIS